MTSFCSNSLKFDTNQIKNCHKAAQKARNSLSHCNDDNKFQAKVCAICDTLFIKYKDEQKISVEWLLSSQVKQCLSVSTEDWDDPELLEKDRIAMKQHYRQNCISLQTGSSAHLNELVLSRRSYKIKKTTTVNNKNKKQEKKIYLGNCSGCYEDIQYIILTNCSDPPE